MGRVVVVSNFLCGDVSQLREDASEPCFLSRCRIQLAVFETVLSTPAPQPNKDDSSKWCHVKVYCR
jgi:hypothetical protein